ncbi:MAG: response regulator [Planctomycetes bacterium]|nr:response regulator [Planctomycetota bacterium]
MRALVLDDSSAMRAILRRQLRELGFEVCEAADVVAALDLVEASGAPDLALVDWNLPGRSGLEFVRTVRADRRCERLRVIMVTTELESRRVLEALRAGVDEYLMKPFTRETFESKLALIGLGARTKQDE